MTKQDDDLKADVESQLKWDIGAREAHIGVSVDNGVVILSGYVPSVSEKDSAERAATRVPGVHAIANELEVFDPTDDLPCDAEIAARCLAALRETRLDERVQVVVRRRWVTLEGALERLHHLRAAELAVKHQRGVLGVTNNIHVRLPESVA